MLKRKFKSASTQGHSKNKEKCFTKSETTPDQTLTVRELMTRSAMGMYDNHELGYDYSMDEDDLRGIDPADMFYMAQESSDLVKKENSRKQKAEKDKADKKLKDDAIAEYKKSLESPADA